MKKTRLSDRFVSYFCGFIPRYVNTTIVSSAYTFMGYLQLIWNSPARFFLNSVHKPLAAAENTANQTAYRQHIPEIQAKGGFIEDQQHFTDMTYGKGTMQASGCGIFAIYNALSWLKTSRSAVPDLPQLIHDFEQNGMVLNGFGGTAPRALQKYLTRLGVANQYTSRAGKFNKLAEESSCIILTMFNDRNDIRRQMHTICITRQTAVSDVQYIAHNVYGNGSVVGPCPTFHELMNRMNNGNSKIFFMIGIKS